MDAVEMESCVRGHHISQSFWTPTIWESLSCRKEESNTFDSYAVAVIKDDIGHVVGHVPRKISAACFLFLNQDDHSIICTVTGSQRYSSDLVQGGLEVPCKLIFRGHQQYVDKIKKLFSLSNTPVPIVSDMSSTLEPATKRQRIDEELGKDVWVVLGRKFVLLLEDKFCIESGSELNDIHINFAQLLIRKQFTHLGGLTSTLSLSQRETFLPVTDTLQIVHDRGNHWIVVSTVDTAATGEVYIYDSLYTTVHPDTKSLIMKLFGYGMKLTLMECQQQNGCKDCGVFAIACCTAIAFKSPMQFNQSAMRRHLLKCFNDLLITPFPQ